MKKFFTSKFLLFVILLLGTSTVWAQFTATGTVKDETGEALPGVAVHVQGTALGAFTDDNGAFSIKIPGNTAIVEFSYIGYADVVFELSSSNSNANIAMEDEATEMDEVVITGLGTSVKRSNLANAVASINAEELTGTTIQGSMDGALYGKFKGANISANSGAPGGGISIKLRGVTSLTASSQPLFIIDGVYLDNSATKAGFDVVSGSQSGGSSNVQDDPSNRIADIDPEDIETIEILKGASAAAIYGSRAGAGVVIITTKRGRAGKTKIKLAQTFGMASLLNPRGQRSWDEAKVEEFFGAGEVPFYKAAVAAGKVYDYEDELYNNNGFQSSTRLSASGGNGNLNYFAGISNRSEKGIVSGTGYEKTSVRLNIDQKVSRWIDLSASTNYITSSADRGFFNNDNTGTTMGISFVGTPPWAELHADENGNFPDNRLGSSNFLQTAAEVTNNESVDRFILGGAVTAKLITKSDQSLKLVLRGGVDYYTLTTSAIFPTTLQFQKNGNGTNGASIQGNTVNTNKNGAAILVYDYYTKSGINLRTQFGVTAADFDQNSIRTTASQLIGTQTNLDQAGTSNVNQARTIQKDRGFFVQEEVNVSDKVIVSLGVRGDKSSNNGDANEMSFYPKASLAVNMHKLMDWTGNTLKLRAAFGQSGNFARFGAKYTPLTPVTLGGTTGSLVGGTKGESELGPEKQQEIEVGFDLGILDNKLAFDFTYYVKDISDLLLNVDLPASSGFVAQWKNVGSISNKGMEIGLSYRAEFNKNLRWNNRLSFWKNNATVTELLVPAYNTGGFGGTLGTYRIQEGESPTQLGGIGDAANDPDGDGFIKYADAEPDFNLSWSGGLNFKNFQLSYLWHLKQGGSNVNLTALLSDLFGTSPDFDESGLDPEGTLTNGNYRLSQLGVSAEPFIQDASYLRLREIGLYYKIPRASIGDHFDLKVGVSGKNLLNFFEYRSYDPEVSNFGSNAISSAVEVTPFPTAKKVFFHISATF